MSETIRLQLMGFLILSGVLLIKMRKSYLEALRELFKISNMLLSKTNKVLPLNYKGLYQTKKNSDVLMSSSACFKNCVTYVYVGSRGWV
jgi:hypothetical protein